MTVSVTARSPWRAGLIMVLMLSMLLSWPGTGVRAASIDSPAQAVRAAAISAPLPAFDLRMIQLINTARGAAGRPALAQAVGLTQVALAWSGRLNGGATGYDLQHNPDAWTLVAEQGAANRTVWGENVAWSSSTATTADQIFTAYMNSPGHRANILSAAYHFIGMGTVGGSHGLWNTTEFTDQVQSGQVVVAVTVAAPLPLQRARTLVSAWYVDGLGRRADAGGLAVRAGQLAAGMPRATAVTSLLLSGESLTREVSGFYQQYLGRAPDPVGLASAVARLRSGVLPLTVAAGLLGSAEAYGRAGHAAAGWIGLAFSHALGRSPSAAEIRTWSAVLSRSGLRATATALLSSAESLRHRVIILYQRFLHRSADPAGLTNGVIVLRSSGDLRLQVNLLASAEYAGMHT